MPTYTSLKAVTQPGQSLLSDQIETNAACFFSWGLANIGGFLNVTTPTSGVNGGDMSRLQPVNDPRYNTGQVWQAFRQDWVWESGLECTRQPIHVSGVNVNGTFHPVSETGAYSHLIDYPYGRIIFDTPISTGSVVDAEYSFRIYHVSTADVPWWREIQAQSLRIDDPQFSQWGSGTWDILAENRVQLPHIIVETAPQATTVSGREIGSSRVITHQEVTFHVLAEDRPAMKFLHDVVSHQREKTIFAFDKNEVLKHDRFGLDQYGSPAQSGLNYPDLITTYPLQKMILKNARSYPLSSKPPLYAVDVRMTIEADV